LETSLDSPPTIKLAKHEAGTPIYRDRYEKLNKDGCKSKRPSLLKNQPGPKTPPTQSATGENFYTSPSQVVVSRPGVCSSEIVPVTHETQLANKGTSFLRAHAAQHDIKNSSRMKKADVVRLLSDHYLKVHNHPVIQDINTTTPLNESQHPDFQILEASSLSTAASDDIEEGWGEDGQAAPDDNILLVVEEPMVVEPPSSLLPLPPTWNETDAAADNVRGGERGRRGEPNPEEARICPICDNPVHKRSLKRHMITQHNIGEPEAKELMLRAELADSPIVIDAPEGVPLFTVKQESQPEQPVQFGSHFLAETMSEGPVKHKCPVCSNEVMASFMERHLSVMHVLSKQEKSNILLGMGIQPAAPATNSKLESVTKKVQCPKCSNLVVTKYVERHLQIIHKMGQDEIRPILDELIN